MHDVVDSDRRVLLDTSICPDDAQYFFLRPAVLQIFGRNQLLDPLGLLLRQRFELGLPERVAVVLLRPGILQAHRAVDLRPQPMGALILEILVHVAQISVGRAREATGTTQQRQLQQPHQVHPELAAHRRRRASPTAHGVGIIPSALIESLR